MNTTFETYLEKFGEVGEVTQVRRSFADVSGIPRVTHGELVLFEQGSWGEVVQLEEGNVSVLLLNNEDVKVGSRVTRTGKQLEVMVGDGLLGQTIMPLGQPFGTSVAIKGLGQARKIDTPSPPMMMRKGIDSACETGVAFADLLVPLSVGQRELIIGSNKIGKTSLLFKQ